MGQTIPEKEVDYAPVCPHCDGEIHEIHYRKLMTAVYKEYVFVCPHCRKVLGVGVGVH